MLRIESFHGQALAPRLDALGALRISVFHEYPYLYEGTLEYEREYLRTYLECGESLVALVFDEGRVVGATTALPLAREGPEFQAPFLKAGMAVEEVCYFGESILLPEYRGQGLGKKFFELREAHARCLGLRRAAFCAVDRAADHSLRPADYAPLDGFWSRQGYVKQPHLCAEFVWKEIGEEAESPKSLTFWIKELG